MASAGLKRLGQEAVAPSLSETSDFLPAVGQGAICIESRIGDDATTAMIAKIHHAETAVALTLERAFLAELDGSCRTPIAGLARVEGDTVRFEGLILRPDGSEAHAISRSGPIGEAEALGRDAGRELKARGGPDFFVLGA